MPYGELSVLRSMIGQLATTFCCRQPSSCAVHNCILLQLVLARLPHGPAAELKEGILSDSDLAQC